MADICNITAVLSKIAAERPEQVAMRCPGSRGSDGFANYDLTLTYAELENRSNAIAAGLKKYGITRGVRAVLMVRPSPEFFLLMFALFKIGAVPVLVDPGIAKSALKKCLQEAKPEAFIGISIAHAARIILGWANKTNHLNVTVGKRWFWGGKTLKEIEAEGNGADNQMAETQPDDVAAILFTSGSTGIPKGVVYRHRHFVAQIELLREAFDTKPGGVNLPTFPPFALFDPALGLTSIIPDMDPTKPASADPKKLHHAINKFGIDQLFGSPALVAVLAKYNQKLPGILRVTSAGAPVPSDVVSKMRELLPEAGRLWTPYGATECLPVAVIESRELQNTREQTEQGAGTCVGRPMAANTVRIIEITDKAIEHWRDGLQVEPGRVGEITVAGPTATDEYYARPEATALAKIRERRVDGTERIIHRMGDLGWIDEQGRLWFCGRKSHRVETARGILFTEQVEPVFNTHPKIKRTALVGIGKPGQQTPVLCVELHEKALPQEQESMRNELEKIGNGFVHTGVIEKFLFHPGFPVDIRHNAKIGREKLAVWAATKIKI
ncbi:MAG: olefin beta-lactone synthetase [Arenimonas sp.]